MAKRYRRSRQVAGACPPGTVYVGRPTKWGNPYRVGMFRGYTRDDSIQDYKRWLDRDLSVRSMENITGPPPTRAEIVAALRGKDLSCWCALDEPCHADVLLEIANA